MKYDVLLADPPWKYDSRRTGGSMTSGASQKYDDLDLEDLKSMGQAIKAVTHPASILFLWSTTPLPQEPLEVLKAWGFTFKSKVYWVKYDLEEIAHDGGGHSWSFDQGRKGMGHWMRGDVEELLICAGPKARPLKCQERNVIFAKPTAHSSKPEQSYELIRQATLDCETPWFESLNSDGAEDLCFKTENGLQRLISRAELFAISKREGWHVWGAKVENDFELIDPLTQEPWKPREA